MFLATLVDVTKVGGIRVAIFATAEIKKGFFISLARSSNSHSLKSRAFTSWSKTWHPNANENTPKKDIRSQRLRSETFTSLEPSNHLCPRWLFVRSVCEGVLSRVLPAVGKGVGMVSQVKVSPSSVQ
jgi:hypothetical protein